MGFGKFTLVCLDPHQLTLSFSMSVSLGQPWGRALLRVQMLNRGFPGGTMVKNLPANTGDSGGRSLIPESGKSPGGGNGNPLQYSCQKSREQRSLLGCGPWDHKELDPDEWLSAAQHMLSTGGSLGP